MLSRDADGSGRQWVTLPEAISHRQGIGYPFGTDPRAISVLAMTRFSRETNRVGVSASRWSTRT